MDHVRKTTRNTGGIFSIPENIKGGLLNCVCLCLVFFRHIELHTNTSIKYTSTAYLEVGGGRRTEGQMDV